MDDLTHILFRLGEQEVPQYQPGIPPLIQSTNFYYDSVEDMSEALANEDEIPFYTRGLNPTTEILQKNWLPWKEPKTAWLLPAVVRRWQQLYWYT